MENLEIGEVLGLYGKLLELHGENSFKAGAYLNAPFKLKKLDVRLADLGQEEIISHPVLGKSLVSKILEIIKSGSFSELNKLLENTPVGLIEMFSIRGLGPKKVRELWVQLGIESLGELQYACQENRLKELKGFGQKTQDNITQELAFRELNSSKVLFARMEETANEFLTIFRKSSVVDRVEISGEFRRLCETINALEFVLISNNIESFKKILNGIGLEVSEETEQVLVSELRPNFRLIIHLANSTNFESIWLKTSSSEEHLSHLKEIPERAVSEEEIYHKNGLYYIPPELREGLTEFEKAAKENFMAPVSYEDLKGVLHNHTVWSDGQNTVKEMAEYCITQGWEYLAICDHSQTAFYAGGLLPERVLKQMEEIDEVNKLLHPFKIFKGIESDILGDGSLDYSPEILSKFDLVVASVHSNLGMGIEKAMERLIAAIENPYTTILGHPTGRLLLSRNGYPINHAEIIDACAHNHVVIELNANPRRLDLDWRWIEYAVNKGVKISINPDAHSLKGLLDMKYGVNVAKKANLQKEMVLNAFTLKEFEAFLKENKRAKGI